MKMIKGIETRFAAGDEGPRFHVDIRSKDTYIPLDSIRSHPFQQIAFFVLNIQ